MYKVPSSFHFQVCPTRVSIFSRFRNPESYIKSHSQEELITYYEMNTAKNSYSYQSISRKYVNQIMQ